VNQLHRWICRSSWWRRHVERELLPWALGGVELGDHALEVGPGPGLTTDRLAGLVPRLTALEIDTRLAAGLRARLAGSNVTVVEGDATVMPFAGGEFSSVVSFTMLHHIPSAVLQDRLLAEARRVLRPGGVLAGTDSVWGPVFALAHLGDTMVLSDPATFRLRLEHAGFIEIVVESRRRAFRFRAIAPS
jgi:SAM-dependent methyltransferase